MSCVPAAVVLTPQARAVLAVVATTRAGLKRAGHAVGIHFAQLLRWSKRGPPSNSIWIPAVGVPARSSRIMRRRGAASILNPLAPVRCHNTERRDMFASLWQLGAAAIALDQPLPILAPRSVEAAPTPMQMAIAALSGFPGATSSPPLLEYLRRSTPTSASGSCHPPPPRTRWPWLPFQAAQVHRARSRNDRRRHRSP